MSRIRRALSDSPASRDREAPVLERSQPIRSPDGGLADQFRGEMEKLGGRVVDANSEASINEYIEGLLKHCSRVALSDCVSTRWPNICDRIRGMGIEIVPALREFAKSTRAPRETPAPSSGEQESLFAGEAQVASQPTNGAAADLMEEYKESLFNAGIGITTADYAIADTGTLVLLSKKSVDRSGDPGIASGPAGAAQSDAGGEQHRLISLVPPVHICLLDRSRIVANLTELLTLVHKELYLKGGPPLAMTFISGPSRTADIELTLTRGVHGPREVHVLLCQGLNVAG